MHEFELQRRGRARGSYVKRKLGVIERRQIRQAENGRAVPKDRKGIRWAAEVG